MSTSIEPFPTMTRPQLRHDPALDRWRVEEPVRRIQMPHGRWCWVVTRSADVREVMTDPRFSRRAAAADDAPRRTPAVVQRGSLASMDGRRPFPSPSAPEPGAHGAPHGGAAPAHRVSSSTASSTSSTRPDRRRARPRALPARADLGDLRDARRSRRRIGIASRLGGARALDPTTGGRRARRHLGCGRRAVGLPDRAPRRATT